MIFAGAIVKEVVAPWQTEKPLTGVMVKALLRPAPPRHPHLSRLRQLPGPDRASPGAITPSPSASWAPYELIARNSQLCLAPCKVCVRWLWSGPSAPVWHQPMRLPSRRRCGLAPIREGHAAAGPGRRAIERLIIDDRHLEPDLVHGARDRDP